MLLADSRRTCAVFFLSPQNKGTTVFAVGVGNYNLRELQAVASDPICSHVLTLTSFDQIQSLLTEIQKSACGGESETKLLKQPCNLRTTIQQKTVKPTYLLSVRCQEAGGRKRARDVTPFSFSRLGSLVPVSSRQLPSI